MGAPRTRAKRKRPGYYRAIALNELPELNPWLAQPEFKQSLLDHTGGGERFIEQATPMIERGLINSAAEARAGDRHTHLQRLRRRSFSAAEIARAFAEAWLREDETLYLPRRRPSESALVVYGVPLLVLSALMTLTLLSVFQAYPHWLASFLFLAPLVLIPFALALWLAIALWRGFLQGVEQVTRPAPEVVNLAAFVDEAQAPESALTSLSTPLLLQTTDAEELVPIVPAERTPTEQAQRLSIDGREYDLASLSDAARQPFANLHLCEQEMQRLQRRLAICQSARAVYAQAVWEALQGE